MINAWQNADQLLTTLIEEMRLALVDITISPEQLTNWRKVLFRLRGTLFDQMFDEAWKDGWDAYERNH
jgi:hypothetical protein